LHIHKADAEALALFTRVQTGELSANAAAIEAGWRKRATPLDQVRVLWRKLSADERVKRKGGRAKRASRMLRKN
jgi:hypothetical protein